MHSAGGQPGLHVIDYNLEKGLTQLKGKKFDRVLDWPGQDSPPALIPARLSKFRSKQSLMVLFLCSETSDV
jgi:hypothetical protein